MLVCGQSEVGLQDCESGGPVKASTKGRSPRHGGAGAEVFRKHGGVTQNPGVSVPGASGGGFGDGDAVSPWLPFLFLQAHQLLPFSRKMSGSLGSGRVCTLKNGVSSTNSKLLREGARSPFAAPSCVVTEGLGHAGAVGSSQGRRHLGDSLCSL